MMENYRRLPLTGLDNARDLGGFCTADGRLTKYHRFIRCEVPGSVTEDDIKFLKEYGITLNIDLRGEIEHEKIPNLLQACGQFRALKLPSFNAQLAKGAGIEQDKPFENWGSMYIGMCDRSKQWIKSVLEAIAENDGAVIFNCTTGKDRTGIISAILLGIAGVSHEDIIADYCVSQVYLRRKYIYLFHKRPPMGNQYDDKTEGNLDDPFFSTSPDNMRMLLAHLDENYGGILGYLKEADVSEETIFAIRAKFVE